MLAAAAIVALMTPAAAAAVPPAEDLTGHRTLCTEEWTKRGVLNDEMFDYCMDKQHEGYQELVVQVAKYGDKPWAQPLLDYLINKWTKRGARNDEMLAYSFHEETEGWEDVEYAKRQPNFSQIQFAYCSAKWSYQFHMLNYCLKNG
jgi:hypothetical protein